MKLSEALEQMKDQWIAFRISRDGVDPEGDVVLHSKNRLDFDRRLVSEHIRNVYVTYSGEILPEGYAALF